jgi:hypothetical protein
MQVVELPVKLTWVNSLNIIVYAGNIYIFLHSCEKWKNSCHRSDVGLI